MSSLEAKLANWKELMGIKEEMTRMGLNVEGIVAELSKIFEVPSIVTFLRFKLTERQLLRYRLLQIGKMIPGAVIMFRQK